jgi:hypothetical protein
MKSTPCILPIALAAKTFKDIVGNENFKSFQDLGSIQFINLVEGEEPTWENFTNKAVYTGYPEDIAKIKTYFETFFKEHSFETIKDMIQLFTSTRTLRKEEIKFLIKRDQNKESLFEIATCFQQVTLTS